MGQSLFGSYKESHFVRQPTFAAAVGNMRAIAFNLPQFHPIPENDAWWGNGFTEWRNVVKGEPLFEGHYQPHLPADLGFYDLRLPEAREAQAALASEFGISGFCYYHYWFNGRRLLERPVNEIVASGKPDFPFCLCWANENWTRAWDGLDQKILMEQVYSDQDDLNHIRALLPIFKDERYIKVDGKPLFLVYRAHRLPSSLNTTNAWRRAAEEAGLRGLYLVRVESFDDECGAPAESGFDAALEFQPRWRLLDGLRVFRQKWWQRQSLGTGELGFANQTICKYDDLVSRALAMELPSYPFIRCVCPGWDNTPRRKRNGLVLKDSTPESYERWLAAVVQQTLARSEKQSTGQALVFINAWNEWAEGNHLEPCQKWGRAYLEATKRVLNETQTAVSG
jgi:lipopolysaccharide biosynthesis protein